MLGPHYFYDLIRLARRSRTRDLRMLYGLALLLGLGFIYWAQFPNEDLSSLLFHAGSGMTINSRARFAETFVFTVILVQNMTALLLTPVYVGSAIAEERERKTLDLLFATQMKDREIIFGKLCSRLTHLGVILLGGLPVLSVAQLFGGIDFSVLVANFINTGLILLSVGSVSILMSTICRKVISAVLITYCVVLPITTCMGAYSFRGQTSVLGLSQSDLGSNPETLATALISLAILHGTISIACVGAALVSMRGQHRGELSMTRQPPPRRRKSARVETPAEHDLSLKLTRLYDLPPIHNDPLYWKELNVSFSKPVAWPFFVTFLVVSLAMLLLSGLSMVLDTRGVRTWTERSHDLGILVKNISAAWGLVCCLVTGFLATSAIVRERQQGTMEALLTLPVSRGEILRAKWLGCYFRGWRWWICVGAVVLLGTILTTIHVAGGMMLLAAVFVHAAFFCSVGLFLSVVTKTVLAAHGKMALTVLAVLVGTWIFCEVMPYSRASAMLQIALNPVATWVALAFSWLDFRDQTNALDGRVTAALLGVGLYALLAVAFWLLASWRFGKERSWRAE